jgi:outer membrane lipoprotein-sorting protein
MSEGNGERKPTRRALVAAGAGILALLFGEAAGASPVPPPAPLTPQDRADLARIAQYLNGIRTMTARFEQVAADGGTATGRLWIDRPGRMRFEYDPPSPVLLIADRFYLYYIDRQLVQTSEVGLKFTPAWFLLRDYIAFDNDLIVTRFARGADVLRVTVVEKTDPDQGTLTIAFSDKPLELRQWTILDRQGKRITVTLSDMQFGMALDPKLFIYQSPYAGSYRNEGP